MKYPSKYTDVLVTPANHIVEILMERKASKDGVKLCYKFWEKPEYKKLFNFTLVKVSAALNVYSEKAILNAIDKIKWTYSLQPAIVKQTIIEEEEKLKKMNEAKRRVEKTTIQVSEIDSKERPTFKKSKLDTL